MCRDNHNHIAELNACIPSRINNLIASDDAHNQKSRLRIKVDQRYVAHQIAFGDAKLQNFNFAVSETVECLNI